MRHATSLAGTEWAAAGKQKIFPFLADRKPVGIFVPFHCCCRAAVENEVSFVPHSSIRWIDFLLLLLFGFFFGVSGRLPSRRRRRRQDGFPFT